MISTLRSFDKIVDFTVYSQNGEVILSKKNVNKYKEAFSADLLVPGVYFITINFGKTNEVHKIIII